MTTTILLIAKTSINNYKDVIEGNKQHIIRYVGTRFVESLDPGLPSLALNCTLSNEDKEAISKNILTQDQLYVLFVEGDSILKFGETVKI